MNTQVNYPRVIMPSETAFKKQLERIQNSLDLFNAFRTASNGNQTVLKNCLAELVTNTVRIHTVRTSPLLIIFIRKPLTATCFSLVVPNSRTSSC
jgi:hypothetical protein